MTRQGVRLAGAALALGAAVAGGCRGSGHEPLVLAVSVEPASVAPGGRATVTVVLAEEDGTPAPDGTVVALRVEPPIGLLSPTTLRTTGGESSAVFTAGAEPGAASIVARSGGLTAGAQVVVAGQPAATVARLEFVGLRDASCTGWMRITGEGFREAWDPAPGVKEVVLPRGGTYHLDYGGYCGGCGSHECAGDVFFPEGERTVVEVRGPCGSLDCTFSEGSLPGEGGPRRQALP